MVPMLDPMVPDATLLVAISPAFAGVVLALVATAAVVIAGTVRELRRDATRRPSAAPMVVAHETSRRAA